VTTPAVTDIADLPPARMEQAYLEYRRACYDIVYRNSRDHGIFELLRTPVTLPEFGERMGVVPEKIPVAELVLKALVKYGAVEVVRGDPPRYSAVPGGPPRRHFDEDLIYLATGRRSVEELKHSENYAGILNALTTAGNPVSATFDAAHLPLWEEVLQAPFYRYSRMRAVREIAVAGPRLLDLACGPGFGLLELAALGPPGPDTTVLGIEISPDFVRSAAERCATDDRIRVVRGNLEEPQPFLQEGFFDGAMIVGAYHFLADPEPLWDTAARLLRRGGTFCVAYVLSKAGTYDQEIMDLRFALRRPRSYQPTRADVLGLARSRGMSLTEEFGLGAWRWYSFTRS
jgi:SAM-dependent methyltransferase